MMKLHSWYCPATGMYRTFDEPVPPYYHAMAQMQWIPLFQVTGPLPKGWVLRSYYSPDENAWYSSHRTMSDKTASSDTLVSLYACVVDAQHGQHVGPQKIKNRLTKSVK